MGKHTDRGLRRGQGYTERRVAKDGTVSYVARWVEGGRLRAKTFRDQDPETALEAAEAHVRAMHRAVRSGRYIAPAELTVLDLVNAYLERGEARWEPNTYATYCQRTRGCIEGQIGIVRDRRRVGPLPLTPRAYLAEGWPDILDRLEDRYGRRWI